MADGSWSLAEAKAKFSEVVERARNDGPQFVTRHGKNAVVVVSADEWAKHSRDAGRDFINALLDPAAGVLTDEEADMLFARDPDVGRPVTF